MQNDQLKCILLNENILLSVSHIPIIGDTEDIINNKSMISRNGYTTDFTPHIFNTRLRYILCWDKKNIG